MTTYRNVGSSPITLPEGQVLEPGDEFTGTLAPETVDWFVLIGAFAAPDLDALDADELPFNEKED